jgi:hypothetical protein
MELRQGIRLVQSDQLSLPGFADERLTAEW